MKTEKYKIEWKEHIYQFAENETQAVTRARKKGKIPPCVMVSAAEVNQ